mgnify:CR=1 FL=1
MNFADVDSLYAAIGEHRVSAQTVVQRIQRELVGGEEQVPTTARRPQRAPRSAGSNVGVHVEGLEAALVRGERYREAGADVVFIEAPVGLEQVERVASHFKGVPLLYNMAASGKTPDLPADELGKLGFRIAIYPNWVILAAIPAMQNLLGELKRTGSIAHMRDKVATFKQFTEVAGLPEIQELEERYGVPEDQRAGL